MNFLLAFFYPLITFFTGITFYQPLLSLEPIPAQLK